MESKNRAALGILKMKKNSTPIFCAIIAQVSWDRASQTCVFIESRTYRSPQHLTLSPLLQKGKDEPITPEGLSCIPLPFVDDIRSFPAPKKNSYLTLSGEFLSFEFRRSRRGVTLTNDSLVFRMLISTIFSYRRTNHCNVESSIEVDVEKKLRSSLLQEPSFGLSRLGPFGLCVWKRGSRSTCWWDRS